MATFTITNNRSASEAIESVVGRDGIARYNAGAETGPYPVKTKFNDIAVPLPRTNLKVVLAPSASVALTTTDLVEIEFYRVLRDSASIPGLGIVES